MTSHDAMHFSRQLGLVGPLPRDVTYRVHMGMPIYNKLLEPMKKSKNQRKRYQSRPFVDLSILVP